MVATLASVRACCWQCIAGPSWHRLRSPAPLLCTFDGFVDEDHVVLKKKKKEMGRESKIIRGRKYWCITLRITRAGGDGR